MQQGVVHVRRRGGSGDNRRSALPQAFSMVALWHPGCPDPDIARELNDYVPY